MPRQTKRPVKTAKPGASYRTDRMSKSIRTILLAVLVLVGIAGIGLLAVKITGELAPWQLADEISPDDARKQLSSGAVVLDVRTHEEFIAGHIEKSLFMPLDELTSLMAALPRNQLIITVCRTGVRSMQARLILQEAGYTQVTSLKGGMEAWIAAGFPVVYGEPIRNN
jgi:rhodanese-related sulfurtransferase